ncbi:MAG: hypothetical protein IKK08_11980 [Clostridia bacterium]|nr:hypothetical protein [Clostridia bacterium]
MARHEMHLTIPATAENVLTMRMAVSGVGMLSGLDVALIGDLRTATNECCDCLLGRVRMPERLEGEAVHADGRLKLIFTAHGTSDTPGQPVDRDIAYGILSTMMPQVELMEDELGIVQIICSMPAGGDGDNE